MASIRAENTRRPMVIGAALLGFAGLVTLSPVVALIAFVVLSVLPGWLLVSRVSQRLSSPGRVGVGLVVSVYFTAHLVNLSASILGYGRPAILVVMGLLALGTIILIHWHIPFLAPPPRLSLARARRSLSRDQMAWATAAAVSGIVLIILGASAWHQTPDGWVSGGWNWSDFLVHVSIGSSVMAGNFPPQVPYFAGEPLTYHWFADFHGAIAATVGGVGIIPVFIFSSAAMAGALALTVWELARLLTGRRRTAVIAVVLLCFGGGFGWIRIIGDTLAGQGDPWTLLGLNPYDNTWADGWPFFRIASVLGTGLLPHRATTFGLPGFVAAIVVLVVALRERRPAGLVLAGVIAALLAPFHFYAFPATYAVGALYVIATGRWRERRVVRDGAIFLAPIVLALPFILGPIVTQQAHGAFRFTLGWSQAPLDDGPAAMAFFYLTNLGLPSILAGVALFSRRLPRFQRSFLGSWALVMIIIPNVVVLSSVEFDMNKYFQLGAVATAILAATFIARRPTWLIVAVLAISALSPAAIAIWHVRSDVVALSSDAERAGRFIAENTDPGSVFVTDAFINSPVDLAGRLRITSFGPYVSNLGYDPAAREADVHAIYCDGDVAARNLMARYGATYVLASGGAVECDGRDQTDFDQSPLFESIYRDGFIAIWVAR